MEGSPEGAGSSWIEEKKEHEEGARELESTSGLGFRRLGKKSVLSLEEKFSDLCAD